MNPRPPQHHRGAGPSNGFFARGSTRLKEITKQSQLEDKTSYFTNLVSPEPEAAGHISKSFLDRRTAAAEHGRPRSDGCS